MCARLGEKEWHTVKVFSQSSLYVWYVGVEVKEGERVCTCAKSTVHTGAEKGNRKAPKQNKKKNHKQKQTERKRVET